VKPADITGRKELIFERQNYELGMNSKKNIRDLYYSVALSPQANYTD
jgi:hypothetical protein